MAEKIPQFINKYKDLEDKGFLWEMVKMEIRSFTITFTKTKAKKCRNQEKFLTKEAERQQNLVDSQSTPEHIKSKLEKISFDRSRGACICSRARWYECGERSSKYVLNLEKRNYENKCITSLKRDNGSSISDPEEVLQEQKSFYKNLYSSQNPQVDDLRFNKFFQNEMIKTLGNELKERCEGLLTDSECRYALKGFQKNKSPGKDGLTAEFNSFFWDLLSRYNDQQF